MRRWEEKPRTINVAEEADVIVAGAGPAGVAAAISAARAGAKTILVEQTECLGGVATSGMMSHWCGGTTSKIVDEIQQRCYDIPCKGENKELPKGWKINHEKLKRVLFEMMDEAGVTVRLHSFVSGAAMEGNKVCGIITESKSGREMLAAKVVIDATGDGDVAYKAGAEFQKGREGDGLMQPVTIMFKMGGVDLSRAVFPGSFETKIEIPAGEIQALAYKILPKPAGHALLYQDPQDGFVVANMTNMTGIDGTDVKSLTKGEIACRQQIPLIMDFLNKYVPGYENAFLVSSASYVGVRETRHFKGLYTLNEHDIVEAKRFDDWIASKCRFNFDIHNIKGPGLDENGAQHNFKCKGQYSIPFRCCVPEKIDGLLLAGRNISGTHKAHSNYRVMPICANMGYGTGAAAAVAVKDNVEVRNVDINKVHAILEKQGITQD